MIIGKTRTNQPVEGEEQLKIFENIVDKDGHKRFIEGDITTNENVPYTPLFAKWSLSGTHLMIVLFFEVKNTSVIPADISLGTMELPKWIMDKLVPYAYDELIERKSFSYFDVYGNPQNAVISLKKIDNTLTITQYDNLTLTSDKVARIAFDFIID